MVNRSASKRRKKTSSSDTIPADRISDLPESIISSILSSIPTKDAVATSILSRSWRSRWTQVTALHFDNTADNDGDGGDDDDSVQTLDFADSINFVLLNHCGESIQRFNLQWDLSKSRPSKCVYTWAKILISRNVKFLDLNLKNWPESMELHLPFSLYTSGTLGILSLAGPFRVKPDPNHAVCLPKLRFLIMDRVIYESDDAFSNLISGCPILNFLSIKRSNTKDNLKVCSISSFTLKHLSILFYHIDWDSSNIGDTRLNIDAPAVEELSIIDLLSSHISIQPPPPSLKTVVFDAPHLAPDVFVGVMQSFSSVSRSLRVLDSFEMITSPVKLSFERLVTLAIKHIQWSSLMDVLEGCNVLEEVGVSHLSVSGNGPWKVPDRVPGCFSSLKRVAVGNFNGLKREMEMLRFFMDNCLVLERVDICCEEKDKPATEAKRSRILNKVSKLSRASPACQIACLEFSAMEEICGLRSLFCTR